MLLPQMPRLGQAEPRCQLASAKVPGLGGPAPLRTLSPHLSATACLCRDPGAFGTSGALPGVPRGPSHAEPPLPAPPPPFHSGRKGVSAPRKHVAGHVLSQRECAPRLRPGCSHSWPALSSGTSLGPLPRALWRPGLHHPGPILSWLVGLTAGGTNQNIREPCSGLWLCGMRCGGWGPACGGQACGLPALACPGLPVGRFCLFLFNLICRPLPLLCLPRRRKA